MRQQVQLRIVETATTSQNCESWSESKRAKSLELKFPTSKQVLQKVIRTSLVHSINSYIGCYILPLRKTRVDNFSVQSFDADLAARNRTEARRIECTKIYCTDLLAKDYSETSSCGNKHDQASVSPDWKRNKNVLHKILTNRAHTTFDFFCVSFFVRGLS